MGVTVAVSCLLAGTAWQDRVAGLCAPMACTSRDTIRNALFYGRTGTKTDTWRAGVRVVGNSAKHSPDTLHEINGTVPADVG